MGDAGAGRDGVGEPNGETTKDTDITLGEGLLVEETLDTSLGEEVASGVSAGEANVVEAEGVYEGVRGAADGDGGVMLAVPDRLACEVDDADAR